MNQVERYPKAKKTTQKSKDSLLFKLIHNWIGQLFGLGLLIGSMTGAAAQVQIGGLPAMRSDQANIHGVQFYKAGDQMSYPVLQLGQTGGLELHFDDFDPHLKSYSYSYLHCDENWQPTLESPFDYIQGFREERIRNAQFSSISPTKYVHYSALLPTGQATLKKSGNYLLKVFLDGDTSKLAFERRLLVVDPLVTVAAAVVRPNAGSAQDLQKLNLSINVSRLKVQNPQQQIRVMVLQNYRWDNAVSSLQPSFMRGVNYEYNAERDLLFAAGKEYRFLDLLSFRFQSERIAAIRPATDADQSAGYEVDLLPDLERKNVAYLPYQDFNGFFKIGASEQIRPSYQGSYGAVHFKYKPQGAGPYVGSNLYVLGQFNNYQKNEASQMRFNPSSGYYEKTLLLKQGYYSYLYGTSINGQSVTNTDQTEGNYWETENTYTVLVYFQGFSDRSPQLVGLTTVSSR